MLHDNKLGGACRTEPLLNSSAVESTGSLIGSQVPPL